MRIYIWLITPVKYSRQKRRSFLQSLSPVRCSYTWARSPTRPATTVPVPPLMTSDGFAAATASATPIKLNSIARTSASDPVSSLYSPKLSDTFKSRNFIIPDDTRTKTILLFPDIELKHEGQCWRKRPRHLTARISYTLYWPLSVVTSGLYVYIRIKSSYIDRKNSCVCVSVWQYAIPITSWTREWEYIIISIFCVGTTFTSLVSKRARK